LRAKRDVAELQVLLLPGPEQKAAESAEAADGEEAVYSEIQPSLFKGITPEAATELFTPCFLEVGSTPFSHLLNTTERYGERNLHRNRAAGLDGVSHVCLTICEPRSGICPCCTP